MMPEMKKVLIVDDEDGMRHMLRLLLEREGYEIDESASGAEALNYLCKHEVDIVLCDIRMPTMDGLAFLKEAVKRGVSSTFIMMSAYGSIETAIRCMKEGAYDYVSKPFKSDEIVLTFRKAEERIRLQSENRRLKRKLSEKENERELIFKSRAMLQVSELIRKVANVASSVLITGETGTGKELSARAIHREGPRADAPFIALNCSAIAATLLESELFGHAKGAFTGANHARDGLFRAADKGTLFLDEIGELPLDLQPKLLRVLQEGEVLAVGETHPRRIDVRVLAATAKDLRKEVSEGRFREDLYYRLNVVEIHLPPLRERPEDVPFLAEYFLRRAFEREGGPVPKLLPEALDVMTSYRWPGNIRELENFIEKTAIFCRGDTIDRASLPWEVRRKERGLDEFSLKAASERIEREYIVKALSATDGNRTRAAKLLEISLRSLLYKIKEYGLDRVP